MRINPTIMRWLAIVWTITILIGCLAPHAEIPSPVASLNDKLMHVAIFVPFSFLWMLAGVRLPTVLLFGLLLGAIIEGLQYVLPINRSCDLEDLIADSIGTIVGAGLALAWYRLFPKRGF